MGNTTIERRSTAPAEGTRGDGNQRRQQERRPRRSSKPSSRPIDARPASQRRSGRSDATHPEDDATVPVFGLVDIVDTYAFVRTSGYLAGPDDAYISAAQIKKYGLRRGDAIVGARHDQAAYCSATAQPLSSPRSSVQPTTSL